MGRSKPIFTTRIAPLNEKRYNNTKSIAGVDIILNSMITSSDSEFVNKIGVVTETSITEEILEVGDLVVLHHNVFRRYWGFNGDLRSSGSYVEEDEFYSWPDEIYAYNRGDGWVMLSNYCFVIPEKNNDKSFGDYKKYTPLMGEMKYSPDGSVPVGSKVSFSPLSEHKYELDGENLYRMKISDITAVLK